MSLLLPIDGRAEFVALDSDDNFVYRIPSPWKAGDTLTVHIGCAAGWEYACVSTQHRCPVWEEMAFIKSQLWEPEDCVVEYHPPLSQYVNIHPYCLWMFRPINGGILRPPTHIVGTPNASPEFVKWFREWAEIT